MNERNVTEDDVRNEHLQQINPATQWAYLFGVLIGGFLLMVGLIAALAGTT